MECVSTVALIERKPTVTRDLFTRYWRDVHGVMAARIPGFETYTQNHVTLANAGIAENFEGIAIVTYLSEKARDGLIHSKITPHIHRDEQNVFRRALLYNLDAGAMRQIIPSSDAAGTAVHFIVPTGVDLEPLLTLLIDAKPIQLTAFDLTSGDPSGWNDTDVDDGGQGRRFNTLLVSVWPDAEIASRTVATVSRRFKNEIGAYRVDDEYVMVEHGHPTHLGLRGMDALRTIEEIGAANQLAPDVIAAVYGEELV